MQHVSPRQLILPFAGALVLALWLPTAHAETVGVRPYELDWAGRTNDDHTPLVDFEHLAGWTASSAIVRPPRAAKSASCRRRRFPFRRRSTRSRCGPTATTGAMHAIPQRRR